MKPQLSLTQEQIKEIIIEVAKQKNGFQNLLKIALEALMNSERKIHNEMHQDVSNGYRIRKTYGHQKVLELQVPRSRYHQFYPVILGLLKEQEEECEKLAFSLYGAGLTTRQVGEIFGELYGKHYSSSQISRLFEEAREEVKAWLERPLEEYYPIILIDAVFLPTRRNDTVSKEAYYTILSVKSDKTREVLAIINFPTESSMGWKEAFENIKHRGVKKIGLVITDGLKGIEDAISEHFPGTPLQLCVVHLERNVVKYIKPKDKAAVVQDFKQVFRTGDSSYTKRKALKEWEIFTEKWGKHYPGIKRMRDNERIEWYFTYLEYDYRVQRMLYTTNWIERLNREYKRTIKMRGALPNTDAVILLLGYVAMTRKYFTRKVPGLDYEQNKFNWSE